MVDRRRSVRGFSLIELLVVISLMAIVVGLVLPSSHPSIHDQLLSVARIVASDLAYARSLAVTHSSYYRIEFDLEENRYVLEHSGTNAALDKLPDSPFGTLDDASGQYVMDLKELPYLGQTVRIAAVGRYTTSWERVGDVEFGPLGETARSEPTRIWLSGGGRSAMRYVWISVNPVTGLATVGPYSADPPPGQLTEAEAALSLASG